MSERQRATIGRRFPALNAVRAIGALMVVLTHCAFNTGRSSQGWTGAVLSRFDFGVALFFVVSGFLLARPWFIAQQLGTPRPAVPHYLWKRALRILPLYWAVVVVAMLVDPDNRHAGIADWISVLTLTHLYRPGPQPSSLTQMWSLCTEVAFYLLLPLLVRLLSPGRSLDVRRLSARCGMLALVGLGWATFATPIFGTRTDFAQWLPGYLPWFLAGVAMSGCSVHPAVRARLDASARDLAGWWILAIGLFAIACSPLAGPRLLLPPSAWEGFSKCLLYGAAAVCLVFPLVFGPELEGGVRRALSSRVPSYLGDLSFGVFAIHMLVLVQGMRLLGIDPFTGHFPEVAGVTLVASLLLAAGTYRFVERPFLGLKNRGPLARHDPAITAHPTMEKV